jgi:hypothetical protein
LFSWLWSKWSFENLKFPCLSGHKSTCLTEQQLPSIFHPWQLCLEVSAKLKMWFSGVIHCIPLSVCLFWLSPVMFVLMEVVTCIVIEVAHVGCNIKISHLQNSHGGCLFAQEFIHH